jgi:hypothetical protein
MPLAGSLPKGTKIKLANGTIATIVYSNECRVRVRPETFYSVQFHDRSGKMRSMRVRHPPHDIAPTAEVEVVD